ncbi:MULTISPECIES: ZIP family metal transporter [Alishewanella]|uniref:Zinc/iron permease n=2 Tax=Alishewanella TaxID=111142 RepID=H3ZDN6_9ALTE|nr:MULTISPECIES: ZIP family metal transporter [Alishewanella]EHR41267.1 zinc/iron permease [Alishewanella jeotgali KCTC 22429]EJI86827.1 zinc/iron permease [Alishewanella aestuarii B11]
MLQIVFACFLVCLVSLSGGLLLRLFGSLLHSVIPWLLAVAIGVLLADALFHLLPEALASSATVWPVLSWLVVGLGVFFLFERGLNWQHRVFHRAYPPAMASFGWVSLSVDALHNLIDGALIATSFLLDPALGWATTLAILLHELPQEISDTAILVAAGASLKKAVGLNLLAASTVFIGAALVLSLGQILTLPVATLLAITAGGFIYIALFDLLPRLQRPVNIRVLGLQISCVAVGMVFIEVLHLLNAHH